MTAILALITIAFESLMVIGQVTGLWSGWLWFWGLHALACVSYTSASLYILPENYKNPLAQSILFIFILTFSMPVVGMVGLTALYIALLKWPKSSNRVSWRRADPIELPNETQKVSANVFGVAGLKDILLYHPDPSRRLDAVKACRYIPNRDALPLFRLAITDNEDDVRLLAFSFIDKMESELTEKINNLKATIARARKENADLLVQLGGLYWEFYYLGLSEGAISRNYLNAARDSYLKAAQIEPMGQVYIKLGRVYLAQHELDKAAESFKKSLEYSAPLSQAAFYLAEIAFERKEYDDIERLLCASGSVSQGEYLDGLKEYWCETPQ